jgi:hypothetical protein
VQKLQGWTVNPKSRKFRGFGAKTGAQLELVLNGGGLRVDSKETQGLFSKIARPKGYLLIWVVGSGSTAQIKNENEPVRVDLIRWITIPWLRSKRTVI